MPRFPPPVWLLWFVVPFREDSQGPGSREQWRQAAAPPAPGGRSRDGGRGTSSLCGARELEITMDRAKPQNASETVG